MFTPFFMEMFHVKQQSYDEKTLVPHPRTGQSFRSMLDYVLCLVVTALVRQSTSQTEAILALRTAVDRLISESGRVARVQDDPLDIPHLEASILRLHGELVTTSVRLELAYRYVQRARTALMETDTDRDTDPGGLLNPNQDP